MQQILSIKSIRWSIGDEIRGEVEISVRTFYFGSIIISKRRKKKKEE